MYSDALSVSLLQLCDRERLSYEDAAEALDAVPAILGGLSGANPRQRYGYWSEYAEAFIRLRTKSCKFMTRPGRFCTAFLFR